MAKKAAAILAVHAAVIDHFDEHYGRNDTNLASWQQLCKDVGTEEGSSITKCKKNLRGTFVNIVDFVQARETGKAVRTFASARALSDYMRKAGRAKVFPKEVAKRNPILRWMLIELR